MQTNGARADVALSVENLTKVFGSGRTEVRALDSISFTAARGEIVLIMGPSGSGKTTLLTIVGGLLRPTSGSVWVGDLELTALKERQLTGFRRHHLGFVFQSFNLLEALTAQENVEAALNFAGVRGHRARERARDVLAGLNMGERLHAKPRTLSGGERQRVSIARALANEPQLLLADEPTANLDTAHGHEVVLLLRDIAKGQGRTVVIVSHDQRIRSAADRVLWLQDGRFHDIAEVDREQMELLQASQAHGEQPASAN
jgi:putative ABC transport system ATP-binding protein